MKRAVQLAFFLIMLGSSAIAAHAQTSEDLSSLLGDPTISVRSPGSCTYTPCVEITWTGTTLPPSSMTTFFFAVLGYPPTGIVIPPDYSCVVTGSTNPINCDALTMLIGHPGQPEFIGVNLIVYGLTDGETFGFSATGGRVNLVVPPDSGLSCTPPTPCAPNGAFLIGTTPEPGTALLYMTGIVLFLVGFATKRFRASFLT